MLGLQEPHGRDGDVQKTQVYCCDGRSRVMVYLVASLCELCRTQPLVMPDAMIWLINSWETDGTYHLLGWSRATRKHFRLLSRGYDVSAIGLGGRVGSSMRKCWGQNLAILTKKVVIEHISK